MTKLRLRIVQSSNNPDLLSVRLADDSNPDSANTLKRALVLAGFRSDDVVELSLVERCETCNGVHSVAVNRTDGSKHAIPCPACRADEPCSCGLSDCPQAQAIKEHGK